MCPTQPRGTTLGAKLMRRCYPSYCARLALLAAGLFVVAPSCSSVGAGPLPTVPADPIRMSGLATGTLSYSDGCLRLQGPERSSIIVWPRGTRFRRDETPPRVIDPKGIEHRVGEVVSLGGGQVQAERLRYDPRTFTIISQCDGPVFQTWGFSAGASSGAQNSTARTVSGQAVGTETQPQSAVAAPIAFPRQRDVSSWHLQSLMTGTLALRDGCLRVNNSREGILVIWPGYSRMSVTGSKVTIVDTRTGKTVSIGDRITVSGGETSRRGAEDLIGAPLPANCQGPFWLAGPFEAVPTQN